MNLVIASGGVCADPQINQYQGQNGTTTVARYRLAVNRRVGKNTQGQNSDQPTADYLSCVAFGKTAEFVEKYVQKGTRLLIKGRIQTGSYTNKDGQKVYTTDVVVEEHEFMGAKPQNQGQQTQGGYQYQAPPQAQNQQHQYQAAPQNYGYQAPPQMPPQAPPQMTNEQFMQIPSGVEDSGLPFN